MKGKHYNAITLSHPLSHTKTLSYIHTIKHLLFDYSLPTTYPTYYILP